MRKKLFDNLSKSLKLSNGTWLRISLDEKEGYRLFDPLKGREMGRILLDVDGHWVYDGELLSVAGRSRRGDQQLPERNGCLIQYLKKMTAMEQLLFFPEAGPQVYH